MGECEETPEEREVKVFIKNGKEKETGSAFDCLPLVFTESFGGFFFCFFCQTCKKKWLSFVLADVVLRI